MGANTEAEELTATQKKLKGISKHTSSINANTIPNAAIDDSLITLGNEMPSKAEFVPTQVLQTINEPIANMESNIMPIVEDQAEGEIMEGSERFEDTNNSQMNAKLFRFQPSFSRPFMEGQGPVDVRKTKNYNQKLTSFIQDELDFCKIDHMNHSINVVSNNVENYFKQNLIRRFDQIQDLKQRIAEQQLKNFKKDKMKAQLTEKFFPTEQSQHLIQTFKACLDREIQVKHHNRLDNLRADGRIITTKENLNSIDKRRVLEAFVENDIALSLLLDFISQQQVPKPGMARSSMGTMQSSPQLGSTFSRSMNTGFLIDQNSNTKQSSPAGTLFDTGQKIMDTGKTVFQNNGQTNEEKLQLIL